MTDKVILIHHHLGLGDHFICNGLVRELLKIENATRVYLPVKYHNFNTVRLMYLDDDRIYCLPVVSDREAEILKSVYGCKNYRVGFENVRKDFDVSFYDSVGVPFEKRWESFRCNRNKERENILEKLVNFDNRDFVLIHETGSNVEFNLGICFDGLIIKVKPITLSDKLGSSMTDWYGLIEKAKEIHCIDSSFVNFCASIRNDGYIYNVRLSNDLPKLPRSWKIINGKEIKCLNVV